MSTFFHGEGGGGNIHQRNMIYCRRDLVVAPWKCCLNRALTWMCHPPSTVAGIVAGLALYGYKIMRLIGVKAARYTRLSGFVHFLMLNYVPLMLEHSMKRDSTLSLPLGVQGEMLMVSKAYSPGILYPILSVTLADGALTIPVRLQDHQLPWILL